MHHTWYRQVYLSKKQVGKKCQYWSILVFHDWNLSPFCSILSSFGSNLRAIPSQKCSHVCTPKASKRSGDPKITISNLNPMPMQPRAHATTCSQYSCRESQGEHLLLPTCTHGTYLVSKTFCDPMCTSVHGCGVQNEWGWFSIFTQIWWKLSQYWAKT